MLQKGHGLVWNNYLEMLSKRFRFGLKREYLNKGKWPSSPWLKVAYYLVKVEERSWLEKKN